MTRKEAITNLNMISVAFVEPVTKGQRELIDDTFNMAIKALEQLTSYEQTINKLTEAISEQATILDKIIADIQNLRNCSCSCSDGIIDDVEDIIDKYRGEVDCRECKAEHDCYNCKKYEESEVEE